MKDKKSRERLQYILKLLDDDTPEVREAVKKQLKEYGEDLEEDLFHLEAPPDAMQIRLVKEMLKKPATCEPISFYPGKLVKHINYNYRGVVVDVDRSCKADDDWYASNKAQPNKNQPWYYILVHNSISITYAAQSNLEADNHGVKIRHPLINHFFSSYMNHAYVRNNQPWPK